MSYNFSFIFTSSHQKPPGLLKTGWTPTTLRLTLLISSNTTSLPFNTSATLKGQTSDICAWAPNLHNLLLKIEADKLPGSGCEQSAVSPSRQADRVSWVTSWAGWLNGLARQKDLWVQLVKHERQKNTVKVLKIAIGPPSPSPESNSQKVKIVRQRYNIFSTLYQFFLV